MHTAFITIRQADNHLSKSMQTSPVFSEQKHAQPVWQTQMKVKGRRPVYTKKYSSIPTLPTHLNFQQ